MLKFGSQEIFVMGPWLNIMDPEFNLHLREDAIDEAWVVKKPSEAGIVTGIELIDKQGTMFNQFLAKENQAFLNYLSGLNWSKKQ